MTGRQLFRRAKLLNADFQACVFDVIASHAVADYPDSQSFLVNTGLNTQQDQPYQIACSPSVPIFTQSQTPATLAQIDSMGIAPDESRIEHARTAQGAVLSREVTDEITRVPSLTQIYAAQYKVTASVVLTSTGPGDLPRLGRTGSLLIDQAALLKRSHSTTVHEVSSYTDSSVASESMENTRKSLSVPAVQCQFVSGEKSVWVIPAPVKALGRMQEKVAEYCSESAPWPRTGSILDPVRATVVCQGPAEMLEVAGWFLSGYGTSGTAGTRKLTVCRVKNKFAQEKSALVCTVSLLAISSESCKLVRI